MVATSASSPAATKPRGIALHLGLNAVSAAAYAGWDGPLAACEFDANDMAAIARRQGMKATVLLTKKATRNAMLAAIRSAASTRARVAFFVSSTVGRRPLAFAIAAMSLASNSQAASGPLQPP